MTPAQIAALRSVSERCRASGSLVWLEPAAVDALLDALESETSRAQMLRIHLGLIQYKAVSLADAQVEAMEALQQDAMKEQQ